MSDRVFLRGPDWVILGVSDGDGVLVFASDSLSVAELRTAYEVGEIWPPGPNAVELSATMRRTLCVRGATYAEAVSSLFATWTPQDRQTAIARAAAHYDGEPVGTLNPDDARRLGP